MGRTVSLIFAWAFIAIGVGGMIVGVLRLIGALDGDRMRGLADIVVGGFVVLHGEGNRRDAAQ